MVQKCDDLEEMDVVRRLNVPLTVKDSEMLQRLARLNNRSEGKTAQKLLREILNQPSVNEIEDADEDARKLNVPLTEQESEKLKKLAKAEGRSEGRTAQNLIREGLEQAKADWQI